MKAEQIRFAGVEPEQFDIVNSSHPARDFGLEEQKGFRTVEDFDARFGYLEKKVRPQ